MASSSLVLRPVADIDTPYDSVGFIGPSIQTSASSFAGLPL